MHDLLHPCFFPSPLPAASVPGLATDHGEIRTLNEEISSVYQYCTQ